MNQEKEEIATREEVFVREVIADYKLACESREASLLGRKEVLTGKAKFGIFGDGKELAQIAMAKQFKNGDFRSGYYRDQTFMMAIGALSIQQAFAALYAHTNADKEPASAGRQMGGHFSTRSLNADGTWRDLTKQKNSSADISPTAAQMPRLLGLAQASKVYRQNKALHNDFKTFSDKGNEVAFGTIGDASTSEGLFFETMNAAGVLQVPMVMSVWDDGYGISVPKEFQTTGGSISQLLKGLQRDENRGGYDIYNVKGWDYPALVNTYEKAVKTAREEHVPILIHVEEVTQPQGHSTSGSHERYKSPETLQWGKDFDCIKKMREWILEHDLSTDEDLEEIEKTAKKDVRTAQKAAWKDFHEEISVERDQVVVLLQQMGGDNEAIATLGENLKKAMDPVRKDIFTAARKAIYNSIGSETDAREELKKWLSENKDKNADRYNSHLYSQSAMSALKVEEIKPEFSDSSEEVDGRLVLRDNFDALFTKYPLVLTYGEDVGKIGGVNQSMEGMQEKFGQLRVSDAGIREASILGQGIGMAMRGLRPIAEIQYLDYLLYALQIMSDDLATLHYRTKGGQKAPVIIRTRGHRLEGIWHSGSPLGTIIHAIRGIYVCVPRNMVTAAGFYNTLLKSDDPALVIEPLNGYRLKEQRPDNLAEFTIPLGVPEIVREGNDITIVSYGSTCNLAEDAATQLLDLGIDVELIDVRTLLPFDKNHLIVESLKKTNRLLIVDEDVPGGASAFILDKILNEQNGYFHLDSKPVTLTSKAHRPAYGSDGDYFSKPNIEDIVETTYSILHEADPESYPKMF
ncbi:transketolase [Cryomorpha ignava]|uniref:3-methyl-2-oxobutanoate dehydrogenase (2-methylpropanoyl-transferring) n=1 Tax=Cryomorpha ignava TaxID=101383 RepID=A0A7K3WPQ5_9FLAO|nr:alpha-ketoacid dehydrogenase subunit alpha/beta [Cryomorpha ignava]NEN23640.1 transketolase [Cryomorpha ignava]